MSDLDRLPPDQRAVLSLVLERGKSYGEVADMLAIPESAVRERAHAALDALAVASVPKTRPGAPTVAAAGAPPRSARSRVPRADTPRAPRSPRSSRTGGALLLAAILVVIVVVVVVVSGGGKSSSHKTTTSTTASQPSTSTSTSSSTKTKFDNTITLTAAEPGLKATGKAYVLSRGGQRAFYISAQGLPPSSGFFYAVWLYNSQSDAKPLGRAPTVSSTGTMEGGDPLPSEASRFHQLILTRETSNDPSEPGPIVLTGPFSLH